MAKMAKKKNRGIKFPLIGYLGSGLGIVGAILLLLLIISFFLLFVGGVTLYVLSAVFGFGVWSWTNAVLVGLMIFIISWAFTGNNSCEVK